MAKIDWDKLSHAELCEELDAGAGEKRKRLAELDAAGTRGPGKPRANGKGVTAPEGDLDREANA
jgi:hypothetical protein